MGFTPHRAAKAGSDLSRSGLLPAVTRSVAAVSAPTPKVWTQCWRSLRGEPGQLVVDTFDLAGELAVTTGKQPKCMLSCCYRRRQPTRAKANAAASGHLVRPIPLATHQAR